MAISLTHLDTTCGLTASARIHKDDNGLRWVFMLNFTNIDDERKSENKFYMSQLIEDRKSFVVVRRWGRVGANAFSAVERYTTLAKARESFSRIFHLKSGNQWPLEQPFEQQPDKHALIDLDQKHGGEENILSCSLPRPVQDFLELVCDSNTVTHKTETLHVGLESMPLGKLSKAQIAQGYTVLQRLSDAIEELADRSTPLLPPAPPDSSAPPVPHVGMTTRSAVGGSGGNNTRGHPRGCGNGKGKAKAKTKRRGRQAQATNILAITELRKSLKTLSSEFYTLIPHSFGRSLPPTLRSMEDIKQKLELLEALSNILHPLDLRYRTIQADMEPIEPTSEEYKMILTFAKASCELKRNRQKLEIHSILKVARPAAESHAEVFAKITNHQLLWHGTCLSNVVGILSQGLQVAPPNVHTNGSSFGTGIYFSDAFVHSALFCKARDSRIVLFLAEVALGNQHKVSGANYTLSLESVQKHHCDSTLGQGNCSPPVDDHHIMPDGVVVPMGKLTPVNRGIHGLLFNEYIVYRPEQVKLRYVLTVTLD